jgi:transposase
LDTQKKQTHYRECDESEREAFLSELAKIPKENRVWVDETGMDSDEIYPYGWAPRGQRCEAQKNGNRSTRERINLVAGLRGGTLLAPFIFKGYCDGNFFIEWLKALLPSLQKGDVVILDNAPFHPKENIINLLETAGYKALFLPRYSPRDNKIEHHWAPIQTKTRQILSTISDINAALSAAIVALN